MLSVAPRNQPKAPVLTAPATCPSYSALPPDVLRLIFTHISLHPLLTTVSVVCKRWHKCALESVTKLRLTGGPHPALAILPSITELHVKSPIKIVPSSLRRLSLCEDAWYNELFRSFALAKHIQLEHLASVHSCGALWDIVRHSRTSLTHLAANLPPGGEIGPLPALVSLELSARLPVCPPLLACSASQLTSLRINASIACLADLALPRLAHLAVPVATRAEEKQLQALAQRTPSLTSLTISTDSVFPIFDRLAPLITTLDLSFTEKAEKAYFSALSKQRFQHMRRLHVRSESLDGLEQLIACTSNTLEKVSVAVHSFTYNMRWVEALAKCKNLSSLRLFYNPACFYTKFLAGLQMPALRTLALAVYGRDHTSAKLLDALRVRVPCIQSCGCVLIFNTEVFFAHANCRRLWQSLLSSARSKQRGCWTVSSLTWPRRQSRPASRSFALTTA